MNREQILEAINTNEISLIRCNGRIIFHSNGLPCQVPRIFGWFFGHFLSVQFVDEWEKNRSSQKNDSKLITPNSRFVWFSMLCYITIAIKYRKFKRIFSDIKKLFVNANIFNFRIKKLVRVTFV